MSKRNHYGKGPRRSGLSVVKLEDCVSPDDAKKALAELRSVVSNFKVEWNSKDGFFEVWGESRNHTPGIGVPSADLIERNSLISELRSLGFRANTVPATWISPFCSPSVCCSLAISDYTLEITLDSGSVRFSFWPRSCRIRSISEMRRPQERWSTSEGWSPIEVIRHWAPCGWSNAEVFGVVRTVAALALENGSVQSILASIQSSGMPERSQELDDQLKRMHQGRIWRKSRNEDEDKWSLLGRRDADSDVGEETGSPVFLGRYGTEQEAQARKQAFGQAAIDFQYEGDRRGVIDALVVDDLEEWDSRTDAQVIRDELIESLRHRGFIAETDFESFRSNRRVDVLLRALLGGPIIFVLGDTYLSCSTTQLVGAPSQGRYEISCTAEETAVMYGIVGLISEAKIRRTPVHAELLEGLKWKFVSEQNEDRDDELFPSDAFEGGYVGDGIWITSPGHDDFDR